MQKSSLRNTTSSILPLRHPENEIRHFPLPGLLPEGYTFALNIPLGTLALLSHSDEGPMLWMEQQFTNSEVCVLLPLLQLYPHYCPYEVMLAHFNSRNVDEQVIVKSRNRLQEAQELGIWEYEMRPVRNVLSRTRLKIQVFNIDIISILETGYVLMYRSRRNQKEA
ncbi:MAG TPA: hypothetical protein VNG51_20270 [Ktedonobacteraceae bacterium]|nr:hypothetical protein [Ktedonobacteraceae bacterium]